MSLTVTTGPVTDDEVLTRHRLVFDPQGDLLEASRVCEAEVFLARYGNTRQQLDEEYGPYADQSVFVSLVDGGGEVLATARLIAPGPLRSKTLVDCAGAPWFVDGMAAAENAGLDHDWTWDVTTVSARPDHRRDVLAAAAVYHGALMAGRANDATGLTAILDSRVRRMLGAFGLFLRPLPGTAPAPYLGSPSSTPVYASFGGMLDEQKRTTPEGYRLLTLGIGLDGVSIPPLSAFRLPKRVLDLREPRLHDLRHPLGVASGRQAATEAQHA